MSTGAESPETITHAFVLNGMPWAWSMLEGQKVYSSDASGGYTVSIKSKSIENRRVRLAPGWYAVILGKGRDGDTRENYEMCKAILPEMKMPSFNWPGLKFRRGCVVGIVKITHSLPYEWCKSSSWASGAAVCNIISKAGWLDKPIACKGNLGACPIKDESTLQDVRYSARCAMIDGNIFDTNGGVEYPYVKDAWNKKHQSKRPRRDAQMTKFFPPK